MTDIHFVSPREQTLDIVRAICDRRRVPLREVMGSAKHPRIARVRWQAYVAVAKARPEWSIAHVARFFDRNHATLLHAFHQVGYAHGRPRAPRRSAV